jgi:carbon-monoxide dehydrogenase large subunit
VQAAFDQAAVTVRERFTTQRYAGMPMEPRTVLAEYERGHDRLTVWSSTQVPHVVQQHLVDVFGLPSHRVRVMAPDVGGGFGTKVCVYPEDVLVPLASRVLGRAVKWTEERREHFLASAHARDQVHQLELAASSNGTILGIRDHIWLDY